MFTFTKVHFLLMTAGLSAAIEVALASEPDLEIHYTFKPEPCKRKAKVTDILTLHYKGTLENGLVFDSR